MANWWFGVQWFRMLMVPINTNPLNKGMTGIQTTGPQASNYSKSKPP